MGLHRIFRNHAPHRHVQRYQNASVAWMAREQERLSNIALELGIDTQICRYGNCIELGFKNVQDAAMLRLRAFGNDYNPGQHIHHETFETGDEPYRDAYLNHAKAAIDDLGLACRIERDGNQVSFRFDTNGDHAVFTEMRDRGVFHHLALTDIGGPSLIP